MNADTGRVQLVASSIAVIVIANPQCARTLFVT
jgi:hypothetical protein